MYMSSLQAQYLAGTSVSKCVHISLCICDCARSALVLLSLGAAIIAALILFITAAHLLRHLLPLMSLWEYGSYLV